MEIKVIDDLKKYLSQEWLLDGKEEMGVKFKELAKILLNKVAIKKGNKLYFINDIEFYFFSDNDRDIITYPRNCKAGQWFFHPSGVDISFESNVETTVNSNGIRKAILKRDSVFGGILLRGIYLANPEKYEDEAKMKLDGPMKVLDAMFDKFDAFKQPEDFPQLVLRDINVATDIEPKVTERKNLIPSGKKEGDKVKSICYNYEKMDDVSDYKLEYEFKTFLHKEYRFIR